MKRQYRLLDLFCGAGGAAVGYHQAGFEVVGVDNRPQPRYPFEFIQADALGFLDAGGWQGFDAIHASPPCQAYSKMRFMWNAREYPDLVGISRVMLRETRLPYVIENVPGAPMQDYIVLCGSMFGLGCEGAELRRHRLFEVNPPLLLTPACNHNWKRQTIMVCGHAGGWSHRVRLAAQSAVIGVYGGHGRNRRRRLNGQNFPVEARRQAMGISWMTGAELSQAIPPAYTKYIGEALMRVLEARDVLA